MGQPPMYQLAGCGIVEELAGVEPLGLGAAGDEPLGFAAAGDESLGFAADGDESLGFAEDVALLVVASVSEVLSSGGGTPSILNNSRCNEARRFFFHCGEGSPAM